ncbi:MAG: class I SAM-dependent methyltransferase [Coleofasciculaceae cyanobacterium SM2_3_26]|nr:class I SAM-dependent methyltransferase [Coleofasciculaceae cyanobacterium SM2_3_26]
MPSTDRPSAHWTSSYTEFGELIYKIETIVYQNDSLTQHEIALALAVADGSLHSPILDAACGVGRHAIALAGRGYEDITAIDGSTSFVNLASMKAKEAGVSHQITFQVADLRHIPLEPESVQTITCIGNSFGYFSDEENSQIIAEFNRVLKPSGAIVMDVTSRAFALQKLSPTSLEDLQTELGRILDIRTRRWDEDSQRLYCTKTFLQLTDYDGQEFPEPKILLHQPYDIRLYSLEELETLFATYGFLLIASDEHLVGSKHGLDNDLMTSRVWLKAVKQ